MLQTAMTPCHTMDQQAAAHLLYACHGVDVHWCHRVQPGQPLHALIQAALHFIEVQRRITRRQRRELGGDPGLH